MSAFREYARRFRPQSSVSLHRALYIFDDFKQNVVEAPRGPVSEKRAQLADVRDAVAGVLKPRSVRELVRNVLRRDSAAREMLHKLRQFIDSDRFFAADVEDFTDRAGMVHQADHGMHRVGNPGEGSNLTPVAVNRDWSPHQDLLDEARDHHSVRSALARPDGVEEAADDNLQSLLDHVGASQVFVERLRGRITPSDRGTQGYVVGFAKTPAPLASILPVDFGRRCHKYLTPVPRRSAEHDLGPDHVGHDGVDRPSVD